ncbi:hypothetical protein EB001_01990 [bacterium]|nr:hypothetical protein [bacterium]
MCESLGTEPLESEIPVDYEDLPVDAQEALQIYNKLRDEWDGFNGVYLGKNYAGILDIFTILDVPVEDRRTLFDLINMIDRHRMKALAEEREARKSQK